MTSLYYLSSAVTAEYNLPAYKYITDQKEYIQKSATRLGLTSSVIAGAMAEEHHAYADSAWLQEMSDWWALHTWNWDHEDWLADYESVGGDNGHMPSKAEKLLNPVYMDLGYGNFKMSTAIRLIHEPENKAEVEAFELTQYQTDYHALAEALYYENSPNNPVTAQLYGLMLREAKQWFEDKNAWGENWDKLSQEFKDSLYISYVNFGPRFIKKKYDETIAKGELYEPKPGIGTGAGMDHLANSKKIGQVMEEGSYGFSNVGSSADEWVILAKENSNAGIAARYSLHKLLTFILPEIDYEDKKSDLELDIYSPTTITGLTESWLKDRAKMLSLKHRLLMEGHDFDEDYINPGEFTFLAPEHYQDLTSGLELEVGNNARRSIIFGTDEGDQIYGLGYDDRLYAGRGSDVLRGLGGADYLEGGSANDTLQGDGDDEDPLRLNGTPGNDTLVGGTGFDTYIWEDGDGTDIIRDVDGRGRILINDQKKRKKGSSIISVLLKNNRKYDICPPVFWISSIQLLTEFMRARRLTMELKACKGI